MSSSRNKFSVSKTEFQHLTAQLVDVIAEGYSVVQGYAKDPKFHFDRYYDFPRMVDSESPFPKVEVQERSRILDYGSTLQPISFTEADTFDTLASFKALLEHITRSPGLALCLGCYLPIKDSMAFESNDILARRKDDIAFLLARPCGWLLDRYVHMYDTSDDFDRSKCVELVETIMRFLTADSLSCDICVPILFTQFGFDRVDVCEGIYVERMSDDYQLARRHFVSSSTIPDEVFMSATHWVVFENRTIDIAKPPRFIRSVDYFSDVAIYPISDIDLFMASLRVISGVEGGYAQLLIRPKSWAYRYAASLPSLKGTVVRDYPMSYEKATTGDRDYPYVTKDECEDVCKLYMELNGKTRDNISVAVRRLNYCYLRLNAEDVVVDATIGLEALLSSDSMEISHKIAMRIAILASISDPTVDLVNVFAVMKKVYSYRSAVVHGQHNAEKKRMISDIGGMKHPMDAGQLAIRFLRTAIKVLVDKPKLRNPNEIDKLMLNSLAERGISLAD